MTLETLHTAAITWQDDGSPDPIALPRSLWPKLLIGARLLIETSAGDMLASFVEVGPSDEPILNWPYAPNADARWATVRFPTRCSP